MNWPDAFKGKKIIFCSLGTYSKFYKHAEAFYQEFIKFMSGRKDYCAVLHVSDPREVKRVGLLPPNVIAMLNVPQIEVLRRAALLITHGGPSSVREAIYFGVPMIVLPCWLDQHGNAARVVYHGLGVASNLASISHSKLSILLEEVTQPRITENVRRMRAAFREEIECDVGFEFIISHLDGLYAARE